MARVALPLTVVDTAGNAVQGASVTVRKRSDNSLATLYTSEAGGVTTGNPATTNTQGRLPYWIDRGAYAAAVTGTGITPYTENFEAAPAKDAGVDTTWGSLLTGGYTSGTLAARPATPSTTRDQYYATDDWGGTLYAATANLAGWTPVASKNQQILDVSGVTSATFSGLDGDTDGGYVLEWVVDTNTTNTVLTWRANGDAGATNYQHEIFSSQSAAAVSAAASATEASATFSSSATGANRHVGRAALAAKTGGIRLMSGNFASFTLAQQVLWGQVVGWWVNTASNLTSLTLLVQTGTMTGRFVLRRYAAI